MWTVIVHQDNNSVKHRRLKFWFEIKTNFEGTSHGDGRDDHAGEGVMGADYY